MPDLLKALEKRVVLGDGACGTRLLALGRVVPFEALNVREPEIVLSIHRSYVEAGAELIKTNSFGANRARLKPHGLDPRELNLAAAALARKAAGPGRFVAGSIGPDPDGDYADHCRALADGGCDALILETFGDKADLAKAVAAGRATGLPVISGAFRSEAIVEADVTGINCVAPDKAIRWVQEIRTEPRSAFPSGGVPGNLLSPGEFAIAVARLVEVGVRLIGGCCGTGAEHIRAAAERLG